MIALLAAAFLAGAAPAPAAAGPPPLPDTPGAARALAILATPGAVYVGTPVGLFVLPEGGAAWTHVGPAEGLPDPYVAAVAEWNGRIWVGTPAGLAVLSPALRAERVLTEADGLPDNGVTALLADGPSLWIGTADWGVARRDSASTAFEYHTLGEGLPSMAISRLGRGGGTVWVATENGGVARFDRREGRWRAFSIEEGLPSYEVLALDGDGDEVWVGTRTGGIGVYDVDEERWRSLTEEDGLSDAWVNAIALDGRVAWVGTPEGLDIVDRSTGRAESVPLDAPALRTGPGGGPAARAKDVASLAALGRRLWVGWADAGATPHPKELPSIRIAPALALEGADRADLQVVADPEAEIGVSVRAGDDWTDGIVEAPRPNRAGPAGWRSAGRIDLSRIGGEEVSLRVRVRSGGAENEFVERYHVDRRPPAMRVDAPAFVPAPTVRVEGRVADRDVREVRVAGRAVEVERGAFVADVPVDSASGPIRIEAEDAAGNVTIETRVVGLDRTPPTISLESVPATTRAPILAVRGRVVEAKLRSLVAIPGDRRIAADPLGGSFEAFLDLLPGPNRFTIVATDEAGNEARATLRIEYVPSRPFALWETDTSTWRSSVTIGGTVPDGVERVFVEPPGVSVAVQPGAGVFYVPVPLAPGWNTVAVTAYGPAFRQTLTTRIERSP